MAKGVRGCEMRISAEQRDKILDVVRRHMGAEAHVWIFGSRADDRKRGGDIDLYVEARPGDYLSEVRCRSELEDFFDQRVDLVVNDFSSDKPIYRIAKAQGIEL